MNTDVLPSERIINTWNIKYQTTNGYKINGKLTVTNIRLLYDSARINSDNTHNGLLKKLGNEDFLIIQKNKIKSIKIEKSFLTNKIILELNNDSKIVFDYGIFKLKKLLLAIDL